MKTPKLSFARAGALAHVLVLSSLISTSAIAALTVSPIFGSNMVLQRGTTVPVFGTADPGATVTVQFQSQNVSATANSSGKWQANLSSMSASSSPGSMTVTSGSSSVTFTGVQVGEVWLCSGQSNMGKPLSYADGGAAAAADAPNHNIRLFRMTAGNGPSTTTWTVSDATTAANFTAVGYWMGLELSEWFGTVPIGLIQATHDGTSIDHWEHSDGGIADDYDSMVKAIQPFAVKGVAWYQGESNGGDANYATELTDMIVEWRSDWGLSTLPFGIIQLADRSSWDVCRNAQLIVSETVGHAFLVVIKDLPGGTLHPTAKKPVGIRTAIGARGYVYGENIEYSGPIRNIPASFVSGSTVILNWNHTGNGLFTSDGLAPGPFAIADSSGRFQSATATIVNNTVQVFSSRVSTPTQVQYAYGSSGNLFNHVGIPTEGGSVIVDRLPASEFQIALGGSSDTTPPAVPTGLSAAAGNGSVNLDWNDNSESDLASYNVKRSTTSGSGYSTIASVATSAYTDNTVNNGTTYYYVVSAVDTSSNESANSSQVSATPSGGGGCTPASSHVATITAGTWNAGQGNKGGSVQVLVVNNCGSPVSGVTVTGTFSGDFNEPGSGVTSASGIATINTSGVKKGTVTFTFCVSNVAGGLSYNPGDNVVTCGGL